MAGEEIIERTIPTMFVNGLEVSRSASGALVLDDPTYATVAALNNLANQIQRIGK